MRTVIALAVIAALAAVVGSIVVGVKVFDGLVVDKPYERGLEWDRTQRDREASGLSVTVKNPSLLQGRNDIVILITDARGNPVRLPEVGLAVSRPSSAVYDQRYETSASADGTFLASVSLPLEGIWDLKFTLNHGGRDLVFEQRISARPSSPAAERQAETERCAVSQGPCRTSLGGQEVLLDIRPKPVRTMSNLVFTITVPASWGEEILALDLSMPGMYMGTNRVTLRRISNGVYGGKGIIPKCPAGRRDWEATVATPAGPAVFSFDVDN